MTAPERRAAAPEAEHLRPPEAPRLPPALVLLVAVAAMSWAGPLVRLGSAPALAVAAWRLTLSSAFIMVVLAATGAHRGVALTRGEWLLALTSGFFLAAHFWSWITSLERTTVASSVVLVSTQPIFVAALSVAFLGERPRRVQWLGILVAVMGAVVIGWGDFGRGRDAVLGDLLAVGGAVFASCYYAIGRRLRQSLDLWVYAGIVYSIAAVTLLLAAWIHPGVALGGYPAGDWLIFLALAAGPMMLGHTGVNYALRYVRAYVANLAVLGEPVGATIIAWLLPGIREAPPLQTLAGGTMILAGILLGSRRS